MKLHEMMIAEQFDTLLDNLGLEAVGLQLAVERKLSAIAAEGVTWRMESGDTGLLRALSGKRRDLLRIDYAKLPEYSVLIYARPFGSALQICWFLFAAPRLVNDIRRALRMEADAGSRFEVGAELDLFDLADLNAFIGATKLALRFAIRQLTDAADDLDDGANTDRNELGLE